MPITAICLLQVPSLSLPTQGAVRAETLADCVLLHTPLDFADDPEDIAAAVRGLIGEPLALQHDDERGLFLIPSVAAPKARSYAQVIEEVADGGVWAPWQAAAPAGLPLAAAGGAELSGLLGSMLGQMPDGMFARAAAQLQEDPSLLRDAAAQLPGLLQQPGALEGLLQQGGSQLPDLAGMLKGMGLDVGSADMARITGSIQEELARDPSRLLAMAEGLFGAQADDTDLDADENENEEDGEPEKR